MVTTFGAGAGQPPTPRILAVGDNVVDRYPDLGVMYPGGNAVNVAVHARRCGADSAYIGVLGDDEAGRLVHQSLTAEGVDSSLTRFEAGPNAHAVVRLLEGNRVFESGEIGVSRITLRDSDLVAMSQATIVHTGECSMVEDDLARIAAVAPLLSFDFSERPWDYVQTYAPFAGLAVLSAPEKETNPEELAARVAALGPHTVAVTQGPVGATLYVKGRVTRSPAGSGDIVDTLGAGDAFIARLLVGLARGERPEVVLPHATRYATETCADYGAFGYRTELPPQPALARDAATGR
jgi:fructoselysine 6-kinase